MPRKNVIRYVINKHIFDVGGSAALIVPQEVRELMRFTDKHETYTFEFFFIQGHGDLYIKVTKEKKQK